MNQITALNNPYELICRLTNKPNQAEPRILLFLEEHFATKISIIRY